MLAINLPIWLVDIWSAYSDVVVPALMGIVLAVLTWIAISIKADAKMREAKSEAELAALKQMNEREDTRPELTTLASKTEGMEQSIKYLAEIIDCAFQNSTLDENTKNELTAIKNKIMFGVSEDLVAQLTAEKSALEEQIAGLQMQLKDAATVVIKETRTRR